MNIQSAEERVRPEAVRRDGQPLLTIAKIAAASFVLFVAAPVAVYYFQPGEFDIFAAGLIGPGLAVATTITAVLSLLIFILPYIRRAVSVASEFLTVFFFALVFVLPIQSGPLMGASEIDAEGVTAAAFLPESAIYMVAALLLFIALWRWRQVAQTLVLVSLVVAAGFVGWAVARDGTLELYPKKAADPVLDDFPVLSGKNDVIVILLDELRGYSVRDALAANPALAAKFDGVTFFADTASISPRTLMSVPNILTGGKYPGGNKRAQEWFNVSVETGLFRDTADAGYANRYIQYASSVCGPTTCINARSFLRDPRWLKLSLIYVESLRVASLRSTPRLLHSQLTPELFLSVASSVLPSQREGGNGKARTLKAFLAERTALQDQLESFRTLIGDLRVEQDAEPRLLFAHYGFTHIPIEFDANCRYVGSQNPYVEEYVLAEQTCGVRMLATLLDKLKEIGAYDSTAVVFISDHGEGLYSYRLQVSPYEASYVSGEEMHYHAVSMVKPFGARGPLKVSHAPATLGDTRKTVCALIGGCPGEVPGANLLELAEDAARERTIMQFRYGSGMGDVYDPRRYRFVTFEGRIDDLPRAMFTPPAYKPGTVLDFRTDGNAQPYMFRGWALPQGGGTFTDARSGRVAIVRLPIEDAGASGDLHLSGLLGSYRGTQDVTVYANGEIVGVWEGIQPGNSGERRETVIPARLLAGADALELGFESANPISPAALSPQSADFREIGFQMIELIVRAEQQASDQQG